MIRHLLCAAAAVAICAPSIAAADDLDRARALLAELRFDEARAALERNLAGGDAAPAELAQLYRLLGEIDASIGDADAAREHFRRALSLDPELALAQGASPKLTRPFAAARAELGGARIRAHAELGEGGVLVVVDSDPASLIAGARARFDSSDQPVRASGRERIALPGPDGAAATSIELVDRHGNTVAAVAPPAPEPAPTAPEATASPAAVALAAPEAEAPPLYARWQLWGAVSVGLAATGAWAGLSARGKVGELESLDDGAEYADALALKDAAESRALQANLAFAAAGAAAVTAAVLYWHQRDDDSGAGEPRASVAPVLGDAIGAAASLRF